MFHLSFMYTTYTVYLKGACVVCAEGWFVQAHLNVPINHCLEDADILSSRYVPTKQNVWKNMFLAVKFRGVGVANQEHLPHREECPLGRAWSPCNAGRVTDSCEAKLLHDKSLLHIDLSSRCSVQLAAPGLLVCKSPAKKPVSWLLSLGLFFSLTGPSSTLALESAGVWLHSNSKARWQFTNQRSTCTSWWPLPHVG